jgi:hypothetical protein
MVFACGNLAIREHKSRGKTLVVFEQDSRDERFRRCLGEMAYVDSFYKELPDIEGNLRKATVFKLGPVGTLSPDSGF